MQKVDIQTIHSKEWKKNSFEKLKALSTQQVAKKRANMYRDLRNLFDEQYSYSSFVYSAKGQEKKVQRNRILQGKSHILGHLGQQGPKNLNKLFLQCAFLSFWNCSLRNLCCTLGVERSKAKIRLSGLILRLGQLIFANLHCS